MLFFDLDGVLRMLGPYALTYEPEHWDSKKDGKTVIEIINEHPEMCMYCPESEYLPIVNNRLNEITILTNQFDTWIPFTEIWLRRHIKIPYDVIYTKNGEHKLGYLNNTNDILVEDFPKFENYNRIALITRKYNQHLNVPLRISNTEEFSRLLDTYDST